MTYQTTALNPGVVTTTPSTDVAGDGDTPNIETDAYRRSKPRWDKCRALMLGTEAIRDGGTEYLAQHANESSDRYDTRKVIAALFNGYARTVLASVGILLQEEPTLGKDMPEQLAELWENIDGAGTHGAVFTKRLATAAVVDGLAGVITEYPRANDPRIDRSKASLAATIALETGAELDASDTKALGLRPYFILVKADNVLLPLYETVNGKRTLVLLILREVVTERKGSYGLKSVTRYRVYQLANKVVTYERWTEEVGGRPVRDEGPTVMRNITGIPWSPLPAGEELSANEYKPTLMDLADLNIEHHQIKTNILSLEALACVPTPVRVGAVPTRNEDGTFTYPDLLLGPGNTIEAPATVGVPNPVYWLAPPIDVLEPAMRSLENTKSEMGAMGASFLAPQPVQETAAAKRMDASAEAATVATVSRALKDCLESAFVFAGQYIKQAAGSVALNTDFVGEGIDTAYLAVAVQAYQAGALSLEELRHVMQTGQLPETFDSADILQLLANEAAKTEQLRLERENADRIRDAA